MTDPVEEYMTSLNFEWLQEERQWYTVLPHKIGDFQGKGRGQYVHPELARYLYISSLEARRDELLINAIGGTNYTPAEAENVQHHFTFGDFKRKRLAELDRQIAAIKGEIHE